VRAASVLLLEGNPEEAGPLVAALGEFRGQFRTTWADCLEVAVAALVEDDFDCLIIGLGLPEAAGLEVVELLRDAAAGAALIVLTDEDDALLAFRAIQGGVDDFFVRGAAATHDLCLAVQYAIERAHLKAELSELQDTARALSAIVESTADAIWTKSAKGVIRTWNRGAEQLYGYPAEEVVGRHGDLLQPWDASESVRLLSSVAEGETVRGLETVHRARSGAALPVSLTVSPLTGPRGERLGASVIARDISDRRALEEELTRQVLHDPLTGLPNRALLVDRLRQALAESARSHAPVAVMFLDLDRFKEVNDSLGHLAGDQLLMEVAQRISDTLRPSDTVARLGGDEFVVVCLGTDPDAAVRVAGRITDVLSEPMRFTGQVVNITASIGVVVSPPAEPDVEGLLESADAGMYEAKARGRARTQVFDGSFAARSRERAQLVEELRLALAEDALAVHYQPVVDVPSGALVGVEALARWQHRERGDVPPGVFVPLAEDMGLVAALDRFVLVRACRDAAAMRESGVLGEGARMAVNVSARSLGDPQLVSFVRDTLASRSLPPAALVVEVTETAVMSDPLASRQCLEGLRALGVGVALDDFGTGYSSLTFLRQLPVTHLKIDRSFIRDIASSADDLAIARCVVDLAGGLGIEIVAEGVETVEQLELLHDLGCTTGQGFLWSPAVPHDRLAGLALTAEGARPAVTG
jgi:diguanylate cyclase (GGDEF)-like protein/PAS domain S-box-containing protein